MQVPSRSASWRRSTPSGANRANAADTWLRQVAHARTRGAGGRSRAAARIVQLACAWLVLAAMPALAQVPTVPSCVEDVIVVEDVYLGYKSSSGFEANIRGAADDLGDYIRNVSRAELRAIFEANGFRGNDTLLEASRTVINGQLALINAQATLELSPKVTTVSRIPIIELIKAVRLILRLGRNPPYSYEVACRGGSCKLRALLVGSPAANACLLADAREFGTGTIASNRHVVLSESSAGCDTFAIDGPNVDARGNGWVALNGLAAGTYSYPSTCCITIEGPDPDTCVDPGSEACHIFPPGAQEFCVPGPTQQVRSSGAPAYTAPAPPPPPVTVPLPPIDVSGNLRGCVSNGLTSHAIRWVPDPANPAGSVRRYEIWFEQGTPGYRFGWSTTATSTTGYVRGAPATARIRACSNAGCSGLSSGSYTAVSLCEGGGGGAVSKPTAPAFVEGAANPPPPRPDPGGRDRR